MSSNVIHLPRSRSQRSGPEGLGFFVPVGRATTTSNCCI